jgi:hypothetical protein
MFVWRSLFVGELSMTGVVGPDEGMGLFGLRKGEGNLPRSTQWHPKVFGQDTRATLFSMERVRVIILSPGDST